MAILTELSLSGARELLHDYDLELVELVPLSAGSVNSNFFLKALTVDGTKRSLFARIYEEQASDGAEFELRLNLALAENGIPVANPLRRRDQGLYCLYEGKPFAIYERIDGEVSCQGQVNEARCRSVGRALARVHCANLGGLQLEPSRFGVEQILKRLDRVVESGRASLKAPVERIRRDCLRLDRLRDVNLPKGLIHGDLFRDNVLLSGDEVSGLLDFESASYGSYAYDLMVTTLAWCFGDDLDDDLVAAMFEGYCSVRKLTPSEKQALSTEGAFACVRFASTRLTDFSLRVAEGQTPGRDFRRFFRRQDALEAGAISRILARFSA